MARLLGIDHGEKRSGLALSDAGGVLATPHAVVERERELLDAVRRLVAEEGVGGVVVGLPLRMDGSEGRRAHRVRFFAGRLRSEIGLPVSLWDERQTSQLAESRLVEAGIFGERRKARLDAVAAQIILQGWIDSRSPAERELFLAGKSSERLRLRDSREAPGAPETPDSP